MTQCHDTWAGMRLSAKAMLTFAVIAGCANGLGPEDFPATDDDDDGQAAAGAAAPVFRRPDPVHQTTSSSSSSTTSSTATSGPTSSASGGGVCDNSGDCYQCANCSLNNSCTGELNACMNDPDCTAFMDCLSACVDEICANDCANTYPNGVNGYMNMTVCAFCNACPNDCAFEGQGLCTP